MLGSDEMARDLTQETLLRGWRAGLRGTDPESSRAYLFTVARNTALSQLRRQELERRHGTSLPAEKLEPFPDPSPESDPSHAIEQAELRQALVRALRALPEELRAVFLLSELEDLSYTEIAEIVGCPTGTVGSRKHHAVQKLREAMRRQGIEL
jgi:RNA polymerase sigma-70 factor (ECF subfamily)